MPFVFKRALMSKIIVFYKFLKESKGHSNFYMEFGIEGNDFKARPIFVNMNKF